jgi:hypothetical protein
MQPNSSSVYKPPSLRNKQVSQYDSEVNNNINRDNNQCRRNNYINNSNQHNRDNDNNQHHNNNRDYNNRDYNNYNRDKDDNNQHYNKNNRDNNNNQHHNKNDNNQRYNNYNRDNNNNQRYDNFNRDNNNNNQRYNNRDYNQNKEKNPAQERRYCPKDIFPYNISCQRYTVGNCGYQNCKFGEHNDDYKSHFFSEINNKKTNSDLIAFEGLYNTEPLTDHTGCSVHCVYCGRLIVDGSQIYRFSKNCVWAFSLCKENTWDSPRFSDHPYKIGYQQTSVFCKCSRFLGDFFKNYVTEEEEKSKCVRCEYKVEMINRHGKLNCYLEGTQDTHSKKSEDHHPIIWQSENKNTEKLIQKMVSQMHGIEISTEEATSLIRNTSPQELGITSARQSNKFNTT